MPLQTQKLVCLEQRLHMLTEKVCEVNGSIHNIEELLFQSVHGTRQHELVANGDGGDRSLCESSASSSNVVQRPPNVPTAQVTQDQTPPPYRLCEGEVQGPAPSRGGGEGVLEWLLSPRAACAVRAIRDRLCRLVL